jgi:hypothetical protein
MSARLPLRACPPAPGPGTCPPNVQHWPGCAGARAVGAQAGEPPPAAARCCRRLQSFEDWDQSLVARATRAAHEAYARQVRPQGVPLRLAPPAAGCSPAARQPRSACGRDQRAAASLAPARLARARACARGRARSPLQLGGAAAQRRAPPSAPRRSERAAHQRDHRGARPRRPASPTRQRSSRGRRTAGSRSTAAPRPPSRSGPSCTRARSTSRTDGWVAPPAGGAWLASSRLPRARATCGLERGWSAAAAPAAEAAAPPRRRRRRSPRTAAPSTAAASAAPSARC